ncbi:hypothetical protein KFK09_000455 [Dendrobium nobile]|uniref:Uncharacterized protein n=1 Tax=Dendrobium nobile TaxID=94219 RepID=A0A8T3CD71_DENNO|nr:hypothetical protein KFK09_000455 [Dendrobium nobile]
MFIHISRSNQVQEVVHFLACSSSHISGRTDGHLILVSFLPHYQILGGKEASKKFIGLSCCLFICLPRSPSHFYKAALSNLGKN